MNATLTEQLYQDFPVLYRGRTKSPIESSMCYGFVCDDGWYQVIYDLSRELTDYFSSRPELDVEVVQVKSKIGTLRFHLDYRDTFTEEIISRAAIRADLICEITGDAKPASGNL